MNNQRFDDSKSWKTTGPRWQTPNQGAGKRQIAETVVALLIPKSAVHR